MFVMTEEADVLADSTKPESADLYPVKEGPREGPVRKETWEALGGDMGALVGMREPL